MLPPLDEIQSRNTACNKRVIYPPLAVHTNLRQKLTLGEQAVLKLFDNYLAPSWEIYIQPHLNGLRPDFVLMNPNAGIAVFEVKDWNLDAMHYFVEDGILMAEKDGKVFSIQQDNPIPKVNLYKHEIYNLYCPRVGTNVKNNTLKGWGSITAGVIFPFAETARVRILLAPFQSGSCDYEKYQPISGKNEIRNGNIYAVFPESRRSNSILITEDFAKDLRGWLVEPDFSATQRQPLELDQNQLQLANSRTESGYRRIKGPAGSGKSLVLAARAARLMNEGKSVLIATYNITLWHYLRDLIVRDLDSPRRINNIDLVHFHLWCKRVCYEVGMSNEYDELACKLVKAKNSEKHVILNVEIPALANEAVNQPYVKKYDAVLVDEGQDYQPYWWNVLRKICKPGGEMILVADATQDVYGSAKAWTDDVMSKAGFRGNWAQLSVSYRLPPNALDMAKRFAQQYLPAEMLELPVQDQMSLPNIYPCTLKWIQCFPNEVNKSCVSEIITMMKLTGNKGLANADIAFLTDTIQVGVDVIATLKKYNLRTIETFSGNVTAQRRQKMGFYMGDAQIKATTLHSFKGWEARLLIVCITKAFDPKTLALFYTGLTRIKRNVNGSWLTVVSCVPELAAFGKTWQSVKN